MDDDTKLYGKGIHREAKNGRSKYKSRMVNIVIKYQKKIFSGRWLASHVLGLLQYLLLKLIHLIYRTIPTRRSNHIINKVAAKNITSIKWNQPPLGQSCCKKINSNKVCLNWHLLLPHKNLHKQKQEEPRNKFGKLDPKKSPST